MFSQVSNTRGLVHICDLLLPVMCFLALLWELSSVCSRNERGPYSTLNLVRTQLQDDRCTSEEMVRLLLLVRADPVGWFVLEDVLVRSKMFYKTLVACAVNFTVAELR